MSAARRRWEILGEALRRKRLIRDNDKVSVRRFSSFGLVQTQLVAKEICGGGVWYEYTCTDSKELQVQIRQNEGPISLQEIFGFNNTGNVCVWPSEEVLTYYCLTHIQQFRNKRVLELGGGMTCLGGICLSAVCVCEEILLTDGNCSSVENVEKIIKKNLPQIKSNKVHSRVLRWGGDSYNTDLYGRFDYVLCADCLFFDEGRQDLIDLIYNLLSTKGEAILFAPSRNSTFFTFARQAMNRFAVTIHNKYDEQLWFLHQQNLDKGLEEYDPDIHYPMLMILKKL